MSYHEYLSQDGRLQRRHDNGHRVASARDAINTIEEIYQNANPDSKLWQNQASFTLGELGQLLGVEAARAWYELVWPGAEIDQYTWKQICEMTEAALYKVLFGERDLSKLAEASRSKVAQDSGL